MPTVTTTTTTGRTAAAPHGANGSQPRRVSPPRTLPSGRAALGALLVALAVAATLLAIERSDDGPSTRLVVATRSFSPGERITADGLALVPADLPAEVTAQSFARLSSVEGAAAIEAISEGELIEAGDIARSRADAPASVHEISIALDRDRALDGQLQPGERVDIVATYGTDDTAQTLVVAADAVVASAETGDASIGSAGTVTLTLALATEDDVLRTAHATEVAAVRLVRATRTEPGAAPAEPYGGPGTPSSGPEEDEQE
jgi:Flp pilus assembly protein CpaB